MFTVVMILYTSSRNSMIIVMELMTEYTRMPAAQFTLRMNRGSQVVYVSSAIKGELT